MIQDGLNNKFEKKKIKIQNKEIGYSPIFNFFDCQTEFLTKPQNSIDFKCLLCGKVYKAKLGESGNLKKHLEKNHKNLKNWLETYLKHSNKSHKKWVLDENFTNLAKYFLTSSTAIKELDNPFLRKMLKFDIPSDETFKLNILPELIDILHKAIEEMLKEAKSICLITDLWSNNSNEQFLALGASFVFKNLSKKIRIIGMTPTNGSSNAESIKECIERIINNYDFDKRKIIGISCDQGSSLVRLFRQNENCLFDEQIAENNSNSSENFTNQINFSSTFEQIDQEIQEVANDEVGFLDDNESHENVENEDESNGESNDQTNEEENEENSDPINLLDIEIGTYSVPRYSCAAHKINLAVRSSIKSCQSFARMLANLSRFAKSIRVSNVNSLDFINKKCKLRCENGTRWSSSYLMLESFYNAYEKGAFKDDKPCPVSKEKIVSFLKILHPLYTFSVLTQKTDWTIGDLIPALIIILNGTLGAMNETGVRRQLVEELKKSIKSRFNFELNSKIYLTAAILNTSKLELWYEESYGVEFRTKAIECLAETVNFLLDEKEEPTQTSSSTRQSNPRPYQNSENAALRNLVKSKSYQTSDDSLRINKLHEIRVECSSYLEFIEDITNRQKSTQSFWSEYGNKFPYLVKVVIKLFSIPASSAFIERFFSICGLACNKRSMNMNADTLIEKVLLRVNLDLLEYRQKND